MRVLLIQPTFTGRFPEDYGRPAMYEPLGLAYLAAVLRENGHEPVIVDCVAEAWRVQQRDGDLTRLGMRDEDIALRMRAVAPDVVGISDEFTGFERDCIRLASLSKEVLPDVPVLMGGADATARHEVLIREKDIDLVVRGEGERTLLNVLEAYGRDGSLPDDVPGTTTAKQANPPTNEIEDVDTIPFPARDLLRMETYLEDQTPLMPYAKRFPIGFVISSRGCPYNCIFCSTTKIWQKWRPRSPKNVVDEIEAIVSEYGIREIAFQDDSFLVDPERVEGICDEIVSRKLDITWSVPPGVSPNRLNEKLLKKMIRSGFYRACFPIESGDPEMLQWIRKPLDLDEVREAIALCHRMGVWTYGNFIIGFPEQTAESIEQTAEFAVTCGLDMINLYVAQPYAGSDLYDVYADLGLLDVPGASASTVFHTMYDTKHFTAEELRDKRDEIYRRFMKRRLLRVISPTGFVQLLRKVNTAGRFAYACRVAATLAKHSFHEGRVALFGSRASEDTEAGG